MTIPLDLPISGKEEKYDTAAEVPGETVPLIQNAAFKNENVSSLTANDLLKIALLGTEISMSEDIFFAVCKMVHISYSISFL